MALLSCLAWAVPAAAQEVTTPALTGQSCAGTRFGRDLGCTSNDFTTVVNFTQPPGGLSTCIAGQTITVNLIGRITSNSPERYDGAIFVGERGNNPALNDMAQSCSVGVFPRTPLPFLDVDGDACGDFAATSTVDWRITGAQLLCTALANSNSLAIPYVQVFDNLAGTGCTASNVTVGTVSKCNLNTSAGLTGVTVLGYVNLTKQTNPAGDAQRFGFTSTASSGETPQWTLAGAATDQTLGSSQTKRIAVPLSVNGGSVTLTITEAATTFWEPGVSISCAAAAGSAGNPASFNNATRTITATLTNANFGADCTITNTKRSRITIAKSVAGRATASDQFTVRATGGGTLTDAAGGAISAPVDATTSGAATSAQATFWSQPAQALTIADLAASGSLVNYTSAYACTNSTAGSGTVMPSGSGTTFNVTPAPGDDITCTYTNTPRTVPLTLRKTWLGAAVGDAVNVTATGLSPLASVADTANETDAGAPQVITVGSVVTLAETFTAGDPASYAKTLACTGTNGLSGNTLTAGPADTSIVCTFTNELVRASWTLDKTTSSSPTAAGQTIAYGFSFANTGDVLISGISVADPRLPGLSCTLASLAPGATASCAATGNVYTVTQADVDAGSVANTATATGTPAAGTLPAATDSVTVSITASPSLSIIKPAPSNADNDGSGTVTINDVLTYTVTATNTGNVTLSNVAVSDPQLTPSSASCASVVPAAACVLTGTRTVVLADVTAGKIDNTATASSDQTAAVTASVSTPTSVRPVVANDDNGSSGGLNGGIAVTNVLANDTLNGVAVNAADVTLSQVSTTNANVTLNPATGAVTVAAGTPAGTYTVVYELCENLNPTNCSTASVTVTVTAATIAANDDSGSASGLGGGTAVANVLVNDTLNGVAVNAADVTLSQVSTTNANVTLNPATGAIAVAAGTPAGLYTVVYRLCENLNPTNCDTANVSVTVTAATIAANGDSGSASGLGGGTAVANVLVNDTLNGVAVNAADVTLSQVSTTSPNVTLNPATGAIAVAAGTPAGTYTVVYELCENLNPTNCSTASVTVTVTAATIVANNDSGSTGGAVGGIAVTNVLANDTLGGLPANAADVTLSQVSTTSPNVTLNPATGAIAVAAGTAAGPYTVVYRLCENLNPTNCDTANVSVTVTAATIAANDDNGSADGATGGVAVSNVVANDRLGGVPANLADVTLVQVSTTNASVSLDPATGQVRVAPGTAAGTYTLVYRLCENLNPTNCDTANVSVTVAAGTIEASPDAGSAGGAAGGTAVANVLVNDTLDDVAINPADVTLSEVSTTSANVTLDLATGRVSVATGTPAGTYTLVYQVCENLNPANCDTANVTVTVTAAVLGAENDSGSADSATGGVLLPSVLDNDTLNGVAVNPADVTLSQVSTTDASVTLDTVTGLVNVVAGTAPGTYTLVYRICENLNPSNCDTASVTVLVTAASIVANPDTASLGGLVGGTLPTSVLANDQVNGAPVNPSEVTLTQVSGTSPNVSLDTGTGRVSVAAGTPAGTYTLVYEICEVAVPANCDTTSVTVTVTAAVIAANDDSGSTGGRLGGTAVANVLGNDTLDGAAANPADVTLTQLASTHANIALNVATGAVTVAEGTPAGAYTVDYQICQVLNPANCDTATVNVTVRAAIWAVSPDIRSIDGSAGGTAPPSVLDNDTLGGAPVDPSAVTLSQVSSTSPNVTLDTATGQVSVAPGAPAGTYTLVYQVCENLNPTNCGTTSVTVTVAVDALVANPDQRSIDGSVGGTAPPSVLDNDILGGAAVDPAEVTLAQVSSSSPNVSLDTATGQVSAIAGTPAGTYTLVYEICEIVNPANCSQATVTLTVTAADLLANDDSGSADGAAGGAAGPSVLANDTLNGSPVNPADVTLSEVSSTSAGVSLNPATGRVNVAPGTPAGTHTLVYRVCENLNPANCDTASVTVTVLGPALGANPDAGSSGGRNGGTAVANVLANDTLNGAPAGLADVTLRQVSSTSANVSLDPASGAVSVAAGTPAGTYTLVYEVCERLDPSSCATAAVSVTVTAAALVANADAGSVANGTAGGTAVANVLANDMLGGAAMSLADVTLRQVSSDSASVALDVNTGAVTVAPGTAAGPYTLVYEVCETLNPANCATATVSITVAIVTTAPVAVDDSFTAPEGGPVSGNLAANDTGGGTPGVYTLVAGSGPGNGAIVINADGTFSYTPTPGFVGNDTFRYQVCDSGGNCSTASVSLTITPQPGKLRVSKAASSPQAGAASIVGFTITITNVSAVPVRAAELVDQPSPGFSLVAGSVRVRDEDDAGEVRGASPFTVAGIDVAVGATATVSYLMRVSAGLPAGEYANLATMTQLGAAISNTASARVRTGSGLDPDTEQARVLGKVFDDQNGDGWQDAGERGIPGVRVATVEGLVAETDAHGRFHFEGLTLSNAARGQNVIAKVDAATLPAGSVFTTENPLVRRVTQGLPVRFDFGVRLPPRRPVTPGDDASRSQP